MKQISVLAEGAFGTAIATLLAHNGYTIHLWCYHEDVVNQIKETRTNRFLPGVKLSERIIPSADLNYVCEQSDIIVEAVPVQFLRQTLEKIITTDRKKTWVILSKGIEKNSWLLPSQIVEQLFPAADLTVLSGPSFADEVAHKKLTAVTIASTTPDRAHKISPYFNSDYFKTFFSDDVLGTQACGAFKNVIALGMGILEGSGQGTNAKAFFLTQALAELTSLVKIFSPTAHVMTSLAGIGDLYLTCGSQSKNFRVGMLLGSGKKLTEILQSESIAEGINTIHAINHFKSAYKLDIPVCMSLYDILCKNKESEWLIKQLVAA